ncbi:MAG: transposase [Deltaproteobacteria bacterium]|nr:transposase [Deltaproteobacteria bacterium]
MTQRFGSKIELNIHQHVLVPDGVFVEKQDGGVGFVGLKAPRREDLERILSRVITKTLAVARRPKQQPRRCGEAEGCSTRRTGAIHA